MEQMQRQEDASGQASDNLTVEMTFECIGGTKLIISIIRYGTESERLAGQLEAVIGASQCTGLVNYTANVDTLRVDNAPYN